MSVPSEPDVGAFIKRWTARSGGAERANYGMFMSELCDLIEVPRPDPAGEETELNDYVFERAVRFRHDDGTTSPGRIDLYKKGYFVLEAKQSKKREKGGAVYEQLAFALGNGRAKSKKADFRASTSAWDALMRSARKQAEGYARALDEWPPFLVVVDVGHVIELYADFSRQGKNYAQFPDRNTFRIRMEDLRRPDIRERLKCVWDAPSTLDPAKHAAEVTQDIAALLAEMATTIELRVPDDPESRAEWPFKVSKFLMRCVFAMYAEDIELLPKGAFLKLIQQHKGNAKHFHITADQFFREMNTGAPFSPLIQAKIREFNGGLFRDAVSVEINEGELTYLEKAASKNWRAVEPAIFGTLLEQALSVSERSKFGAHYTPRAYVERLVVPTIIEPLREDWDVVQSDAIGKLLDGNDKGAREVVHKFHDTLCDTRVLDPACGTGNFLYVSMELMKRLEGEVLDFLKELGETTEPLRTVDPHQFLGMELNPRAPPIAELVLWIGYIQWWFRTRERQVIADPILRDFGTIKQGDAALTFDRKEPLKDEMGHPVMRQDPDVLIPHPVTGEDIPDPAAKLPVYRYVNPRPSQWPTAEFIVGNPPFIGGKDLREELGDGYTHALWASRGKKSDSIDLVMYWWDQAAMLLTREDTKLRRFGFITTNKIRQKFSRRIVEKYINSDRPLSLVFSIPDHPWVKAPKRKRGAPPDKKAQVRIAMTVAEYGVRDGILSTVTSATGLETDAPRIELISANGKINADLSLGADLTALHKLKAMDGLSRRGVTLHGDGFVLTPHQATSFGLGRTAELDHYIRPYLHNHDLKARPRGVLALDLFGLSEADVRLRFPSIWQHLSETVKVDRQVQFNKSPTKDAQEYLDSWWIFGKPREELRSAINGLERIIVTGETSKHRFFEFFSAQTIADNKIWVVASDSAYHLGVLSSYAHMIFSLRKGGWMGVGNDPVYSGECFSTFPFPDSNDAQKEKICAFSGELDSLRKRVLAEHNFLTMTSLYNVREKLKSGELLNESEKAIYDAGCVGVIHELHNKIDAAVSAAYGWPNDLSDEEILGRLVTLNKERAEEEKRGLIRWLRPEYQVARAKMVTAKDEQIEAALEAPDAEVPALPKDDADLVAMLRSRLRMIGKPVEPKALALHFGGGGKATRRVERGLRLLAAAGVVRRSEVGWFLPSDRN